MHDKRQQLIDSALALFYANGVQAVEQRLQRRGGSLARRPETLRIAAVGRKTSALLEQLGAEPDFVPPDYVADSVKATMETVLAPDYLSFARRKIFQATIDRHLTGGGGPQAAAR